MNSQCPHGEIERKKNKLVVAACRIPGNKPQDLLNGKVLQLCNFTRDTDCVHQILSEASVSSTIRSRRMKKGDISNRPFRIKFGRYPKNK